MINEEVIKTKLKDRNIAAVARAIGVHRSYLSRFLNGEPISDGTKQKLIAYLLES